MPLAMICGNRPDGGVAPLAVHFDPTTTSSQVWQPAIQTDGYQNFNWPTYSWTFGDTASGLFTLLPAGPPTHQKSKNEALGYQSAHVFEPAASDYNSFGIKTYTVGLTVTKDDRAGTQLSYSETTTVMNPEVMYNAPYGATYYVASNGDDTWSGTLPTPNGGLTDGPSLTAARALNPGTSNSLLGSNGPRRVLFRAGDTFPCNVTVAASTTRIGPYTMGRYGDGSNPNPIIRSDSGASYGIDLTNVDDLRIVDVNLTENGASSHGVVLGRRCLLLRCTLTGFNYTVFLGNGNDDNCVSGCVLQGADNYLLYASAHPLRLSLLDATFQNPVGGQSQLRTFSSRTVIQGCKFTGTSGAVPVRVMGINPASGGHARFVVFCDNHVNVAHSGSALEFFRTDTGGAHFGVNGLVEGNLFSWNGSGVSLTYVIRTEGLKIDVRNNIVDRSNATTGDVWWPLLSLGAVNSGINSQLRLLHNTHYRPAGTSTNSMALFNSQGGDGTETFSVSDVPIIAEDNICWNANAVASTVGQNSSNNVQAGSNYVQTGGGTNNPLFVSTTPIPDSNGVRDFTLQSSSPCLAAGVSPPAVGGADRRDYMHLGRPSPSNTDPDIGAHERQT